MVQKQASNFLKFLFISLGISVLASNHVCAEDFLDRLLERCSNGDTIACDMLDDLTEQNRKKIDRLSAQADAFQAKAPVLDIENGNRPDIKKAYPLILNYYVNVGPVEPAHTRRRLDPNIITICSNDLHDLYFVHGKRIPVLESGKPDWHIIYIVVIDHYFRFCSKQI